MGMDVYGKKATSEEGKYFRNNVWWWRPLANYCQAVAPTIAKKCKHWHTNDGAGLKASDALLLAGMLEAEVESGRCAAYEKEYEAERAALPKETCELCYGTGCRTDEVGKKNGLDKPGGCNGCEGTGQKESWDAGYPFSVDNVKEFITFLNHCGGFEIC